MGYFSPFAHLIPLSPLLNKYPEVLMKLLISSGNTKTPTFWWCNILKVCFSLTSQSNVDVPGHHAAFPVW